MRFIKPNNLSDKSIILDVRSAEEYAKETIDMPHLHTDIQHLNPQQFIEENHITSDKTIYLLCASGGRASRAATMFEDSGFDNVAVIIGGMVEAEYSGIKIIKH